MYFFARVAARVAGGVQERLSLGGRLLEEVALGLLDARLAVLRLLLARLAPAGGDDLVAVFVDHRRDLREFAGDRFRRLVHVDARAGRHRGDVLHVEDRLALAGPGRAPFHRDDVQAADHARRGGRPEVAAVEMADIGGGERFLLVDADVRSAPVSPTAYRPNAPYASAIWSWVRPPASSAETLAARHGRGEPAGARSYPTSRQGRPAHVRSSGAPAAGGGGPLRPGRRRLQPSSRAPAAAPAPTCSRVRAAIRQPVVVQAGGESARHACGGAGEADEQPVVRHTLHVQAIRAQLGLDGVRPCPPSGRIGPQTGPWTGSARTAPSPSVVACVMKLSSATSRGRTSTAPATVEPAGVADVHCACRDAGGGADAGTSPPWPEAVEVSITTAAASASASSAMPVSRRGALTRLRAARLPAPISRFHPPCAHP